MTRVTLDIADHIARVTLTRPDKMNAVDPDMAQAIVETGHSLIGRRDIRAVILSGQGRGFCAGLDVASFAALAAGDPEGRIMPRTHDDANLFQEIALVWQRIEVPVIAALHGVAFGAGLQLASGADIRIAHPDTRLAIMEAKWGLIPDMGGMVLWPRLIPGDALRLLTYTAEPVSAAQARDWGLVTELADDPQARALDIATNIAAKSPAAIRAAKRLIALAESGAGHAETLLAESREQADLVGKPEQIEVIAANLAGRAPRFD